MPNDTPERLRLAADVLEEVGATLNGVTNPELLQWTPTGIRAYASGIEAGGQ